MQLGLFLAYFALVNAAYVPGTPGGSWTKDELVTVKAKLYSIFRHNKAPKAPKVVRLGFHDCLKYADGSGGCDGCLNWQGVGVIKDSGEYLSRSAPNINVTDNNGLEEVVENLEQLYTDPNYPTRAPVLSQSLRDSGKSRADLWAFASMVGVEYGIQINNIACNDPGHITQDPRVRKPTCVHDPMIEECYVRPPRPFKFHFGRADCTEFNETVPYITTKEENHPSPLYNGRKTIDFFKEDFNFTGRETAAIFGAHSFGNPHWWISLIPYTWTSRGINLFNNDYYKSLTGQDRWFFNDDTCNAVGDAYRKRPKTRWMAHAKMATQRGGPIFWIHENLVCPNKAVYETLSDYDKACLDEAETGMDCKADPRSSNGTDLNYNDGCERYRLISGADEIAMTCEMGLYREFEMDDGIIHGCPGLEHFNESMSAPVVHDVVWSHLPEVGRAEPLCPKQRLAEPPGDTPLYQIMEEYASNQTTWISDYITTHEKMVQNGYAAGSLTLAPDHFTNVHCPAPVMVGDWQPTYCYEIGPVTGQPFRIKSRMIENMDKVVAQRGSDLYMELASDSSNQLWQWSERHLINVRTGLPLQLGAKVFWSADVTEDGDWLLRDISTDQVIDAYGSEQGSPLSTAERQIFADWQLFYPVYSTSVL